MALVSTNNSSFLSITIGRAPSGYARDLHSGNTEGISKLFGRVRHCFSHSTVGSSKTRQITIRGRGLNTTNHDMRSIGLKELKLRFVYLLVHLCEKTLSLRDVSQINSSKK